MAPINISVKVENFECTKMMLDKVGGLDRAIQVASSNALVELEHHLRTFAAFVEPDFGVSCHLFLCILIKGTIIRASLSEPHTIHSYEKITVLMYVCIYLCSDTSSMCSQHMRIWLTLTTISIRK